MTKKNNTFPFKLVPAQQRIFDDLAKSKGKILVLKPMRMGGFNTMYSKLLQQMYEVCEVPAHMMKK
jgi:hypothetical protein